jgi:prolipoprotein diacylglyceryltransferase
MRQRLPLTRLSSCLDRMAKPEISLGRKTHSAFRISGAIGFVLAVSLAMAFALHQHLSVLVITAMMATAIAVFFAVALITKSVLGQERLVYYQQQTAILLAVGASLWLLRQTVLPYLDVIVLGIGIVLAVGRIGCFMVGCCHGRPHRFGVCYRREHMHAGFASYYVGVRLFPIQLVESLWVAGIVIAGVEMIQCRAAAGTALAWYIIGNGFGRFFLRVHAR